MRVSTFNELPVSRSMLRRFGGYCDDDRRRACLGAPGDLLCRFIRMGGEVFRGLPDDNARHEARDD